MGGGDEVVALGVEGSLEVALPVEGLHEGGLGGRRGGGLVLVEDGVGPGGPGL